MGYILGDILVPVIGIAISPVPIIAVILMLFSAKARENGPAFLGGWLLGVAGVLVVIIAVTGIVGGSSGGPSTLASLIQLALGILLLVLGWLQWRKRPVAGQPVTPPRWMATVDGMEPMQAFILGVALSALDRWNEAAEAFRAARTVADAPVWRSRLSAMAGEAALAAGDFDAALAAFDAARTEAADDPATRGGIAVFRARALVALQREREAETVLAEARAATPRDATAACERCRRQRQAQRRRGSRWRLCERSHPS